MGVYENVDGNLILRSGSTLYADSPIGVIQPFGGSAIPSGWLLCNGAEVLKTDYAELYAVIGDAFGTASVNTKFVLPDLREATTKGAGLTGKSNNHYDSDGLALGEFIDDRVQTHQHKLGSHDGTVDGYWATNQDGSSLTSSDLRVGGPTADNPRIYATSIVSGRSGATTEVKAVGVNYIIKAKQVGLPADFMSAVDEAVNDAFKYEEIDGSISSVPANGKAYSPISLTVPTGYEVKNIAIVSKMDTDIVPYLHQSSSNYFVYARSFSSSVLSNQAFKVLVTYGKS